MKKGTKDQGHTVASDNQADDSLQGIVEAAMDIASKRAAMLKTLKDALLRGDTERALRIAAELCGLEEWGIGMEPALVEIPPEQAQAAVEVC